MTDRGMKIHPYLPTPMFNRMEERVAERGITRAAFVRNAIERALKDEPAKLEAER